MKKILILLVLGIIVIGFTVLIIWKNYQHSAKYSLHMIEKSVMEKNTLKFEQYVDVNAISEQVIEGVVSQLTYENLTEDESGLEFLGYALGMKLVENLKPSLISLLRSSFIESIETGKFDNLFDKADPEKQNVSLEGVGRVISIDPVEFLGVDGLRTERNVGTFGLKFFNENLDTTVIIKFRMIKQNKRWIVNSFDNLDKYLRDLKKLKEDRLLEVNNEIKKQMYSLIELGKISRRTEFLGWYSEYIHLNLPFKNISNYTITGLIIELVDIKCSDLGDRILTSFKDINPFETGIADKTFRYNEYIGCHTSLRYNKLVPLIMYIKYIDGNDQKVLMSYESWDDYIASLDE